MTRAEVRAEAEAAVRPLLAKEVVELGVVTPRERVAVRRRDEQPEVRAGRHVDASERRRPGRAARLGADRRDPAEPLLERGAHEPVRIGGQRRALFRVPEQPEDGRTARVARLLHAARDDDLDRRHDPGDALVKRPVSLLQHVRDRRAVRLGEHAAHDRSEALADLAARAHPDPILGGVALEVRRADRHLGEPAPQRVVVDLGDAEHQRQAAHADRLEVLGHQVGVATPLDPPEVLVDKGRDQRDGVLLDLAGPQRRVERLAQPLLARAVDQQDVALAHRALERRRGDAGRERLGVGRRRLDRRPGRHEPEADGGYPGHRRVLAEPGVDGIRIVIELLQRDRREGAGELGVHLPTMSGSRDSA